MGNFFRRLLNNLHPGVRPKLMNFGLDEAFGDW
jgi:hypothetical protein